MKIVILDYSVGNLRSIHNALLTLNCTSITITREPNVILSSDVLILPGVGSFKHAMEKLNHYMLISTIKEFAKLNKPIVGICLGMQLLFDSSEEFGYCEGLGLIPGKVEKLLCNKLPNISWNKLTIKFKNGILQNITQDDYFYFIHSFAHKDYDNDYTLAYIEYSDEKYSAIVKKNNIIGCQFHPEKSAKSGLKLLNNILGIK